MSVSSRSPIAALAEQLHEGSRELLALVDGKGDMHLARTGAQLEELLGWPASQVAGDPLSFVHPDDRERVRATALAVTGLEAASMSVTFRARHAERGYLSFEATLTDLRQSDVGALVIRIRAERELDPQQYDARPSAASWRAAGLATRPELIGAVDKLLRHKASMTKGDSRDRRWDFTVVLLELHDFRRIRNTLSEPLVDELIIRIAERFEPLLAPHDVLAYLEEGTFGIMLPGVGNAEEATRRADAFLDALDERFELGGTHLAVSPMVGLATSERHYESPDELIRDAGSAIGKAAQRRRRRLAAFRTQIRSEDRHRIQLLADMAHALDLEEFEVAYQPIIRLRDRALLGFEALARWPHPTLGDISPNQFIPLAEESGFIDRLGQQVLAKACLQMAEWTRAQPALRRLTISVNVSGAQLGDPNLLGVIETAMRDSGLMPEQLRLEMTESMVLEDVERAASAIARLRLYGVTFSLDDFGTGYSSLSLLHRLDYEVIKVDRSFIQSEWERNKKIVAAIISLSHSLSMKVVAEGVETIEQARSLQELNCDAAQGFLFSKPLSSGAATRLIESTRVESRASR